MESLVKLVNHWIEKVKKETPLNSAERMSCQLILASFNIHIAEMREEFGEKYDGGSLRDTPMEIYSMWSIHPTEEECINFAKAVFKWKKKWLE